MRENKTTSVSITIELAGKTCTLTQDISNHDLEDGVASLLNSCLLLEGNLNE